MSSIIEIQGAPIKAAVAPAGASIRAGGGGLILTSSPGLGTPSASVHAVIYSDGDIGLYTGSPLDGGRKLTPVRIVKIIVEKI